MKSKGWIALDIDGTITLDKHSVPNEVIAFLRHLSLDGWKIAFATGRAYAFAQSALSDIDFDYVLLAQNGSLGLEMPGKKILFKSDIPFSAVAAVEKVYEGIDSDFLIYAGFEKGDFCFWRPSHFSKEELAYLEDVQARQKEKWHPLESYREIDLESFPLIKCFGTDERVDLIAKRLRSLDRFEVAKIRDPFNRSYCLLLVTDREASKGRALEKVFKLMGRGEKVIAAGDDENDLSLLEVADVKIAMEHAPEVLQKKAHFIAPPIKELGIIHALKFALQAR
jgi:hypothetical protein